MRPIAKRKPLKLTAPVASEWSEQAAVIQWWQSYARTRGIDPRLLYAIPNAQKFMSKARNIHAAYAQAKAEGLVDGVPDLFLAVPKRFSTRQPQHVMFPGLMLEMKRKGGKASAAQKEMHALLRAQGYVVVLAEGADEAIGAIRAYLGDWDSVTTTTVRVDPSKLTLTPT